MWIANSNLEIGVEKIKAKILFSLSDHIGSLGEMFTSHMSSIYLSSFIFACAISPNFSPNVGFKPLRSFVRYVYIFC